MSANDGDPPPVMPPASPRSDVPPPPSPLQLRLDPECGTTPRGGAPRSPLPPSRASSLDSQTSLEDLASRSSVGEELARCLSPVSRFVDGPAATDDNLSTAGAPAFAVASTFETEAAASVLQKWAASMRRVTKALKAMSDPAVVIAGVRLFGGGGGTGGACVLAQLRASASADAAIALSSLTAVAKDATAFLLGLPRDGALRGLPVALHGPRAFLSALLVAASGGDASRASAVLGEAHDGAEGKAMASAARLLALGCERLTVCLAEAEGTPGRVGRFRSRLVMVRFARRYHAAAFGAFRAADAERAAGQLVQPYAEMFAAQLQVRTEGRPGLN